MYIDPIEYGRYYHIYNHSVGTRDLFLSEANYEYFMHLYMRHIVPVADTFAWAFMKNHFHLLVRLKEEQELLAVVKMDEKKAARLTVKPSNKNRNLAGNPILKSPHLHFSAMFNAYTKAINKQSGYKGALFRRPMQRKIINGEDYLKHLVLYIHNNPIHHGLCEDPHQYPHTSYNSFFTNQYSFLKWKEVLSWYEDRENFLQMHHRQIQFERIEKWLGIY